MNILNKMAGLEKEAADYGFKWETPQQIKEQITSEIAEIEVHIIDQDQVKLQEEIGDLIHAVFSLCVFCGFDPEETLTKSVNKFERRFNFVKRVTEQKGLASLNGLPFPVLMQIWDEAKKLDHASS